MRPTQPLPAPPAHTGFHGRPPKNPVSEAQRAQNPNSRLRTSARGAGFLVALGRAARGSRRRGTPVGGPGSCPRHSGRGQTQPCVRSSRNPHVSTQPSETNTLLVPAYTQGNRGHTATQGQRRAHAGRPSGGGTLSRSLHGAAAGHGRASGRPAALAPRQGTLALGHRVLSPRPHELPPSSASPGGGHRNHDPTTARRPAQRGVNTGKTSSLSTLPARAGRGRVQPRPTAPTQSSQTLFLRPSSSAIKHLHMHTHVTRATHVHEKAVRRQVGGAHGGRGHPRPRLQDLGVQAAAGPVPT